MSKKILKLVLLSGGLDSALILVNVLKESAPNENTDVAVVHISSRNIVNNDEQNEVYNNIINYCIEYCNYTRYINRVNITNEIDIDKLNTFTAAQEFMWLSSITSYICCTGLKYDKYEVYYGYNKDDSPIMKLCKEDAEIFLSKICNSNISLIYPLISYSKKNIITDSLCYHKDLFNMCILGDKYVDYTVDILSALSDILNSKYIDEDTKKTISNLVYNKLKDNDVFASMEKSIDYIGKKNKEKFKVEKSKDRNIGRPKYQLPDNFEEVYKSWKSKEMTAVQAMKLLSMKRTTFYNKVREYEKSIKNNEL